MTTMTTMTNTETSDHIAVALAAFADSYYVVALTAYHPGRDADDYYEPTNYADAFIDIEMFTALMEAVADHPKFCFDESEQEHAVRQWLESEDDDWKETIWDGVRNHRAVVEQLEWLAENLTKQQQELERDHKSVRDALAFLKKH
jgi:hypothetical protein